LAFASAWGTLLSGDVMECAQDGQQAIDQPDTTQPRFGSYIGLFFILAMIGILCFELSRDSGVTQAFNELKPGMSTTQVAANLGVPLTETKSGSRTVQKWEIADGYTIVVEFQDGKLTTKDRKARVGP
jgi:hypothetical protein